MKPALITALLVLPHLAQAQDIVGLYPIPDSCLMVTGEKALCKCYRRRPVIYVIDGVSVMNIGDDANIDIPDAIEWQPPAAHGLVLTKPELQALPMNELHDLMALSADVYYRQRGSGPRISGCRPDEVLYVVDGIKIPGLW